jgi:tetratricopeptide (TPR) repeat protein
MSDPTAYRAYWNVVWPALAIIALFAIGWFVYRPALSGTFLLDDAANLGNLRSVDDAGSALHFVLSGSAGPLGRPLALASFLPQASAWGSDAEPFLRINILIHLLNGLLVFAFARQLGLVNAHERREATYLALAVTALWLFMPLLASSSLMIVQRMTTMSATFVLAGLNGYMVARSWLDRKPAAALTAMSAILVLATLLAVFTKENGILLPVFVLVLEATILSPPQHLNAAVWRTWLGIFLAAPTLFIIVFLVTRVPYTEGTIAARDFTAAERLLAEARILWEYLLNAFVARGEQLGPFHESRSAGAILSQPLNILALAAWLFAIAAALRYRRDYAVAALAVLWFLGGHLLESTTIPLELYFEHRNYLPIIGPVFALCYFVLWISGRYRLVSRAALALYALVNAGILFSIASMWGQPLLAATYWHEQDPASVRAATTLASRQLSTVGPDAATRTLRRFAAQNPEHAYIRIPELNLACTMAPEGNHSELVRYLEASLPSVAFSLTTGEMLDELLTASVASRCRDVQPTAVAALADAVIENPRYSASIRYNQFHLMLLARIARGSGNTDATLEYLERAIELAPSNDLHMMTVTTLVDAERFDEAREFIERAAQDLSFQPLKRYNGKKNLDDLLTYVNEAQRLAGNLTGPDNGN